VDTSLTEVSAREYETDIFSDELAAAELKAEEIIKANVVPKDDPLEPSCTSADVPVASPLQAGRTTRGGPKAVR
jgi:membrane fusion protein (multidrug efflux system)